MEGSNTQPITADIELNNTQADNTEEHIIGTPPDIEQDIAPAIAEPIIKREAGMVFQATTNVPRPSQYETGQNFSRFVERFIQYLELTNLTDDNIYLLFLSLLDSKTYDKLVGVELDADGKRDPKIFTELYKEIIYGREDIRNLRASLMTIRQKGDETMDDYGERLVELAAIAYKDDGVRSENMLTAFLQGIRDKTTRLKLYESAVENFPEAFQLARRIEKAAEAISEPVERPRGIFGIGNSVSDEDVGTSKEEEPKTERKLACYQCGSFSHFKRECPDLRSNDTQFPRRGHYQPRGGYRSGYRPSGRSGQYNPSRGSSTQNTDHRGDVFCSYCGIRNHTSSECRKLKSDMRLNTVSVGTRRPAYRRAGRDQGRQ